MFFDKNPVVLSSEKISNEKGRQICPEILYRSSYSHFFYSAYNPFIAVLMDVC